MPRPGVGNPGNKGNTTKGPRTGRSSAYQEMADAKELHEFWRNDHNIKELQEKIKSGNFSMKAVSLFKILSGNERLIAEVLKKIFPDLSNVQTNAEAIEKQTDVLRAILDKKPHAKKK